MKLNKSIYEDYKKYPERIIQFGEGNFLRAFTDWIIDSMNKELNFNSGVLVVQPRGADKAIKLNEQDGLYTLYINGIKNGLAVSEKQVVNCITRAISAANQYEEYLKAAENPELRFVVSNTTEAGIVLNEEDKLEDAPQSSFPGKLTSFLYHRYKAFNGDVTKGLIILPCELIEKNGERLKEIVLELSALWKLEEGFVKWINKANLFCNTLVDRIVPGYPKDKIEQITKELGFEDSFLVEAEQFHLWVIEGPQWLKEEFPAHKLGLNVLVVDDLTPYRTRKVRILNGAHTAMMPVAYLYGLETVRDAVENDDTGKYIREAIFDEIIPTLNSEKEGLESFAKDVLDRFRNPYINHYLMSISLNSMSKFETRVLPSILEYKNSTGKLPARLTFSLAALISFYKGERAGEKITLSDDKDVLEFISNIWEDNKGSKEDLLKVVKEVLALKKVWKLDLNDIDGLTDMVFEHLNKIESLGMKKALQEIIL